MIVCLTPNPAVDRTLVVSNPRLGEVQRAARTIVAAGGKGLNAARAMRTLGGEPVCMGFLGGHSGRLVADLAEREGLRGAWTWTPNETRTCFIVVDSHGGEPTVFNEPGPTASAEDWARLRDYVLHETAHTDCVCLCGSLPPNLPPEAYADLVRALRAAGPPVWVDTSGASLRAALSVEAVGLKVNGAEAGAALGLNVNDFPSALEAADKLRGQGLGPVVITLGPLGAVLVTDEGRWQASAPPVQAVSTVGSGDAFFGGLAVALTEGRPVPEALRRAVAAGAANALSAGGGQFARHDFEALLASITISHPRL
jgi:1-phosphofructokinase family hexose kinase